MIIACSHVMSTGDTEVDNRACVRVRRSPRMLPRPRGLSCHHSIKETAHMRYLPSLAALAALISAALTFGDWSYWP